MCEMSNPVHLNLDRNRYLLLHFLRCPARPLRNDRHVVVRDFGIRLDRQVVKGNRPPSDHQKRNRQHDEPVIQRKIYQGLDHSLSLLLCGSPVFSNVTGYRVCSAGQPHWSPPAVLAGARTRSPASGPATLLRRRLPGGETSCLVLAQRSSRDRGDATLHWREFLCESAFSGLGRRRSQTCRVASFRDCELRYEPSLCEYSDRESRRYC